MSPRDCILARRAQFIAAAVCSLSVAGCSSADESQPSPSPCLTVDAIVDTNNADTKTTDTNTTDTGEPMACLFAPYDSGPDDSTVTDAAKDTGS